MKIAISAEKPDLTAQVAQRFGISPYLIIIDPETMEIEAIPNPGAAGKQAASIQAVVIAISKEVDTVLTGYCSPIAMKYLADYGIDVVTGVKGTVAKAVAQYRQQANANLARSMEKPDFAGAAWLPALKRSGLKKLIFPGCVLMIYGIVFVINPAGAAMALRSSTDILRNLLLPLGLVFTLMVFMNLFLKPTHIASLLGKGSRSRGIILSAAAGIISMGAHLCLVSFVEATAERRGGEFVNRCFFRQPCGKAFSAADYDFLFRLVVHRPADAIHSIRFAGGWVSDKHPGKRLK